MFAFCIAFGKKVFNFRPEFLNLLFTILNPGGDPPPGDHNFSSAASLARASLTTVWLERPWPAMADHGRPWLAMDGHGG